MKTLALALQGGGSHGAFAWGIIDRLLEEDLKIDGLVGTSAGAMNASVTAYGLMIGGRQGAKDKLREFWTKISKAGKNSPLQPSFIDLMMHKGDMDFSPFFQMFNMMTEIFSPYQFNPLDINPLRDVLLDVIDFDELRKCTKTKLFVCATNALTCRPKVFDLPQISVDAVLASACLPFLFKAVEIDNNAYWDGGYMGNPPIFPLIKYSNSDDILLVKINPIKIKDIPKSSKDIQDRVNEISFNSSLMQEMAMINFKNQLIEKGIEIEGHRLVHYHAISADEALEDLSISSKLNSTWDFLEYLHNLGRRYASEWLQENWKHVGVKSSIDLEKTFL